MSFDEILDHLTVVVLDVTNTKAREGAAREALCLRGAYGAHIIVLDPANAVECQCNTQTITRHNLESCKLCTRELDDLTAGNGLAKHGGSM